MFQHNIKFIYNLSEYLLSIKIINICRHFDNETPHWSREYGKSNITCNFQLFGNRNLYKLGNLYKIGIFICILQKNPTITSNTVEQIDAKM